MADSGTIILNAATVPRVRPSPEKGLLGRPKGTLRHFVLVQLVGGRVEHVKEVWVHVQVRACIFVFSTYYAVQAFKNYLVQMANEKHFGRAMVKTV